MATYIIIFRIKTHIKIDVGRFQSVPFKRGLYLYIGSAKRGLKKRIERHISINKKLYWHIDYILSNRASTILEIWYKREDEECKHAQIISRLSSSEIVKKGLGSSDCNCPTHIFLFRGTISELKDHLRSQKFLFYLP